MFRTRTPTLIELYGFTGTICGYWGAHDDDKPPWVNTLLDNVSYDKIDKLLFTTYGERPMSSYVKQYINDDGEIPSAQKQIIARYVLDIFYAQWARLTADFTAEYNPIENYDMTETETHIERNSGTDTTTNSYNDYHENQKYGHTISDTGSASAYPYDSTTPHPTSDTENTTTYGAAGDTGDDFTVTGEKSVELAHGKVESQSRTLTRHGDIGVKTATEMLESDVTFWDNHNFFETIAADIASLLTVPIYE